MKQVHFLLILRLFIYLFTITLYLSHACEEYARIRHILSNVTFTYGQFKILIYVGMNFSQISNI